MNLRELDARVIPDLARRTQAAAERLRRRRAAGAATVARFRPASRAPTASPGPARTILRLRALDARLTRGGPLALLRDVPQLGGLLVAVLILVNGATVAQRSDRNEALVATTIDGQPVIPGLVDGGTVGPELGDAVVDYVQRADRELTDRLVADSSERSFATVSFQEYLTPIEVSRLLGNVRSFRVFFRVPSKLDTPVEEHPVKTFVPDTLTAFETVAASRRADIPDLMSQAATTDDPIFKADYTMTARQYAQEAEQLERGCACVFAVAVTAENEAYRALRRTPGVRVIDLAPSNSGLDTIVFRGLRPEETVTVTNGNQKRDEAGLTGS